MLLSIEYFFLSIGITVLVGLLWLTLYSLNIHNAGSYLAAKSEFDKWSVFRAITAPLPDDQAYENEFNTVTGNILEKGKKSLKRAKSWFWVGLQYLFFLSFFGGTVLTFIWLIIIGYKFLANQELPVPR